MRINTIVTKAEAVGIVIHERTNRFWPPVILLIFANRYFYQNELISLTRFFCTMRFRPPIPAALLFAKFIVQRIFSSLKPPFPSQTAIWYKSCLHMETYWCLGRER